MKLKGRWRGCALTLLLIGVPFAQAEPSECRDAARRYSSAQEDISLSIRAYTDCVSDSRGLDDCSTEFNRLQSAQDDFKYAVSDYQFDCRF